MNIRISEWSGGGQLLPAGVFGVLLVVAGIPDGWAVDGGSATTPASSGHQDGPAAEQALNFDSDFLDVGKGKGNHIDLSYFAHKGGMQPGRYRVRVDVNGKTVDDGRMLSFLSWPDQPGKLYACVNAEQMVEWWGIIASRAGDVQGREPEKTASEPGEHHSETDGGSDTCPVGGVTAMVPYAKESFDFNKRQLSLTVPQASLGPASRLRTPPQMWNEGMPAILMNYNYNGSQQKNRGATTGSDFLGLNGQMNVLGWRVRNDMTLHRTQGQEAEWNASQVYAQRDFATLGGGQLTVGRTSSTGGSVGGVAFTGVKVESDDAMLDPKFTSYSPAITGIASSPATVTVRQYGKVIDQQNVPQGPFSLTDFNSSGNGDVDVEVREADGRTRHFTLAQAQSGNLLRQGGVAWGASAGQAVGSVGYANNKFVQAGGAYGARSNNTLNAGVLLSADFLAASAGLGWYAGAWGAVSYTLNASRANLSVVPGEKGTSTGMSHSMTWTRGFGSASVGVSWDHSQTRDYYSYSDLLSMEPLKAGESRQKSGFRDRYSISLSQSMGEWGSVSLNGSRYTLWDSSAVQNNMSLSYSTTVEDVGLSLSTGLSTYNGGDSGYSDGGNIPHHSALERGRANRTDRTIALNVSLPLGKWLRSGSSVNGTYSYSRYNGEVSQQAGISGAAMNGALSYSASQGLSGSKTGSTSVGYSGGFGVINGGYSYGAGSSSTSYGVSGALAVHSHGVTPGRQLALSGGNALVEVPGVSGLGVNGAVTDWRGYALVSGLIPYDRNRINVDMTNLPGNVELDTSSKNVVPTRGALVSVPFRSNKGYRILLSLARDKEDVPFGSTVSLRQEDESALPVTGIVGEAGQVYLSGLPISGDVTATWGDDKASRCTAHYALPEKADDSQVVMVTAACH